MTLTVSVSALRNNISAYLARALRGTRVLIRDEKRQKTIAQITHIRSFDKQAYERALKKAAGVFSAKNHPEWSTQKDVAEWVQASRLSDERTF